MSTVYLVSTFIILFVLILSLSNIVESKQSYKLSGEEVAMVMLISFVPVFNTVFALLLVGVMIKFVISDQ